MKNEDVAVFILFVYLQQEVMKVHILAFPCHVDMKITKNSLACSSSLLSYELRN
jgi:hypothetical protein